MAEGLCYNLFIMIQQRSSVSDYRRLVYVLRHRAYAAVQAGRENAAPGCDRLWRGDHRLWHIAFVLAFAADARLSRWVRQHQRRHSQHAVDDAHAQCPAWSHFGHQFHLYRNIDRTGWLRVRPGGAVLRPGPRGSRRWHWHDPGGAAGRTDLARNAAARRHEPR